MTCKADIKLRAILVQDDTEDIWVWYAEDEQVSYEDPSKHEKALAELDKCGGEYKVRVVTLTLSMDAAPLHKLFEDSEIQADCKLEEKTP